MDTRQLQAVKARLHLTQQKQARVRASSPNRHIGLPTDVIQPDSGRDDDECTRPMRAREKGTDCALSRQDAHTWFAVRITECGTGHLIILRALLQHLVS